MKSGGFRCLLLLLASLPYGCGGGQSSLNPAGEDAEKIANLFWWMTGGGLIIWAGMIVLSLYTVYATKDVDREPQAKRLILLGAALPAVVLGILLVYGLNLLPAISAPAPEGAIRIVVHGEQWWWRVRYEMSDGRSFESANEIRIPVGEPMEFQLESKNVIHSFWIPSLGGKMDVIPGRVNKLVLRPTRTGAYRGVCAEFCGTAHAKMTFDALVLTRPDFDAWVLSQLRTQPIAGQP